MKLFTNQVRHEIEPESDLASAELVLHSCFHSWEKVKVVLSTLFVVRPSVQMIRMVKVSVHYFTSLFALVFIANASKRKGYIWVPLNIKILWRGFWTSSLVAKVLQRGCHFLSESQINQCQLWYLFVTSSSYGLQIFCLFGFSNSWKIS